MIHKVIDWWCLKLGTGNTHFQSRIKVVIRAPELKEIKKTTENIKQEKISLSFVSILT